MSDAQWYFMTRGERTGPISQAALMSRARSGLLSRDELVWRDGFTNWVPAGTIKGLFLAPPPAPSAKVQLTWWQRLFRSQTSAINEKRTAVAPPANKKPTKRVSKIVCAANRKMIAQLRDDAVDTQLVAAEMIRVRVRLNPVNIQIHNFIECIDPITEDTPRHEIAQIVQSAMQSVNLANAVSELDKALTFVADFGAEMIQDGASGLIKVWPKARQFIRHRWLDDSAKAAKDIRKQLCCAVQAHRQDLAVIEKHFGQLQEFHPRYHTIMTRNEFWQSSFKTGLRVAAQFIDGGLGLSAVVVGFGADVWNNLRQKDDDKFLGSFEIAFEEFRSTTLAFTHKTEQEVEVVISAFVNDLNDFYQEIIAVLEGIIDRTDISKIYHALHDQDADEKIDDDRKAFLEIVMSNLRDQKVSVRSEANIKRMLGLP